jgi:hypothetical protein
MPRPSHPSSLDYSNYTWRRVQVMKFLRKGSVANLIRGTVEYVTHSGKILDPASSCGYCKLDTSGSVPVKPVTLHERDKRKTL